jgi:DNA-binding transcriptional MerR regulator
MSETPRAIIGMGLAAAFDRPRAPKSAGAFRTISEVSDELDVPQHVLRFWETRFNQVRPLKRAGGRRYYRPEDIELLRRIRGLLYHQGYTIKGVQKLLRDPGRQEPEPAISGPVAESGAIADQAPDDQQSAADAGPGDGAARDAIARVIAELEAIRAELLLLKAGRR